MTEQINRITRNGNVAKLFYEDFLHRAHKFWFGLQ